MGFDDEIGKAVRWDTPAVAAEDSLRNVMRAMVDNGTTAMVVRSGREVAGVVTDMDLLMAIAGHDDLDATKVSAIMTACQLIEGKAAKSPCVQLDAEESVKSAMGLMHRAGIRHLLIAAAGDTPAAVVSSLDLFRQALALSRS